VAVTFTYNLLGVPADMAAFNVILFRRLKGPGQPFNPQFLTRSVDVGVTQAHTETFSLLQKGNYKLHYTLRTPTDAYTGEHVKDLVNLKLKVK
jgi:hypothetical protein